MNGGTWIKEIYDQLAFIVHRDLEGGVTYETGGVIRNVKCEMVEIGWAVPTVIM